MFTIYMDESGFTGEDLLQPEQPVFVHVSTCLSNEECDDLVKAHFSRVQSRELKYKTLSRRPSGRARVVDFLTNVQGTNKFTIWLCHKEFNLLTYLVDLWVEPSMHDHGIDLYKDGGDVALSNMTFYCLRAFQTDQFLRKHLERFQRMMRYRTRQNYSNFFAMLHRDYLRVDKQTQDILVFYIGAGMDLCYDRLRAIPDRALDPALTTAVSTCMHWRKQTGDPLCLIHDKSSSLAKDKWLWDLITSPEIEKMTLGIPGREEVYPLNVSKTEFEDSKKYVQLQFCDLVAGACGELARRFLELPHDETYVSQLDQTGLMERFNVSVIWPSPEVDPEALQKKGWSGEGVEILAKQLAEVDRRRLR
jgi:hypothetical protein